MDMWTRPGPSGRRVRTERWGKGKRWLARWIDPAASRERSRTFERKDEAEAFLARMRTQMADGTWVDPRAGRATVGEYARRWLATKTDAAESTRVWYAAIVEGRVRAKWDNVPVGKVTRAAIIEWLAEVRAEVSASRTRGHYVVVSGALDLAVDDRALGANPARGITLPKLPEKRAKALTILELTAYVAELQLHSEGAACFGLTLGFSGLRFGECIRLDVAHLVGRVLHVEESISTIGGRHVAANTKSHRRRLVPIPHAVANRIREFVGDRTDGPLLPGPKGGRWHHGSWKRIHEAACEAAGIPGTTTHQLRHTAATLAIAAGADVKAVQAMLGHASATMTLDTYSSLQPARLEAVADALEPIVPKPERHLKAL